jgi:tetratricopeptide (TPR) repeat protein
MTETTRLHDLLALSDEVFVFIKNLHTNQLRGVPGLWETQIFRQIARSKLEQALTQIIDSELHNLFLKLASLEQRLYEVDNQLLNVVVNYLEIPVPASELEFRQLREEIKKHVRANGESRWLLTVPYERLIKKAHNLYLRIEGADMQIFTRVQELITLDATDKPVITDSYMPASKVIKGKDKLRREIQSASDDIDIERGIRKLYRILKRQNLTESDLVWVYEALSGKYWALGDLQRAIDYATKAIETGQPFELLYFWRGQLHYQQQQWTKAKDDLEMALAGNLPTSEYEEAKGYLTEIDNHMH